MVDDQRQQVLARAQRVERRPQQAAGREVEGGERLGVQQPQGLGLPLLHRQRRQLPQIPQIDMAGSERPLRVDGFDDLERVPLPLAETGAERLVPRHHGAEGAVERPGVEVARQAHRLDQVVGRRAWLQPVHEPEPLLGEGEGEVSMPRQGNERRRRHAARIPARRLDGAGQGGDRRALEQALQRQLDAQRRAHPRHHLGGQQRVAAEGEEVVPGAHRVDAQHLAPDPGQQLLDRPPWSREGLPAGRRGSRQRFAVDLAARRQRQRLQDHEGRRDHVLRQALPQVLPQRLDPRRGHGDEVGNQPLVAFLLADGNYGLPHVRVAAERRLDLPQLDAEAPHLHLVIDPPQELELQLARLPVAHQVARAVDPRARHGREGVRHEPLGRQVRPPQVAARQPGAADQQLAGHPQRYEAQLAVDDMEPGIGDRGSEQDRPLARCDLAGGRPDRRLGGAVDVPQLDPPVEQRLRQVSRQGLAAAQGPQTRRSLPAGIDQQPPVGGNRRTGLRLVREVGEQAHTRS